MSESQKAVAAVPPDKPALGLAGEFLIFFAVFVSIGLFWGARESNFFSQTPGNQRDDVYYDNLAFHLTQGKGFFLDFSNPDWLEPYLANPSQADNQWILTTKVRGYTTSRAPAFPLLLAATYKIAGRQWWLIQLVNVVLVAFGLTVLVIYAAKQLGSRWLIPIACATLAIDYGIFSMIGQIMTEPLAIFLIALLVPLASEATKRGNWQWWGGVAFVFGLGLLTRGPMNAWLAMILLLLPVIFVSWWIAGRSPLRFVRGVLAFIFVVTVLCSPWWIRNCRQAGAFEPFGCAGKIGWTGGYCDEAYNNWGNWYLPNVLNVELAVMKRPGIEKLGLARQEHLMGVVSEQRAMLWVKRSLGKLPALMAMKAASHLAIVNQPHWLISYLNAAIVASAIVGCFLSRQAIGFWIGVILVMSVITTSLTWSHYGRYSIPIRPLFHVASAYTTVVFWTWILNLRKRRG